MKDIPKRLGSNEALDAAVAAITKAHASFRSRQESIEVLAAYTRAITTLRVYVQDPRKAQTADTLCAIWLIMVCQVSVRSLSLYEFEIDVVDRVGWHKVKKRVRAMEKQWQISWTWRLPGIGQEALSDNCSSRCASLWYVIIT